MYNKHEVIAFCEAMFKHKPETFGGDVYAQREYFNNYIDALCKEGLITEHQYDTWINPF